MQSEGGGGMRFERGEMMCEGEIVGMRRGKVNAEVGRTTWRALGVGQRRVARARRGTGKIVSERKP
jgi:hypothetical protein